MIGGTTITISYNATTASGLQLNSRLYDVFPNGDALMVDRGARRVENASGQVTYQLHGNGWRFQAGHKVRIEVAQDDDPYLRSSTVASTATISAVRLQIPVREATTYVRPKGATPALVSLVPGFQQCVGPGNRQHAGPLTPNNSCNPATESSGTLWFGTPDANGQVANGTGSVRLDVCPVPGCLAPDVKITGSLADVRNRDTNRTDYTGELQGRVTLRVTDKRNGPAQDEAATMVDTPFSFTIQCADNGDPASGGSCSTSTTANAVVPGALGTNTRAIWELGQIEVLDGGSDGDVDTAPNTVFARQGIFLP
jgi:hypothetical protein